MKKIDSNVSLNIFSWNLRFSFSIYRGNTVASSTLTFPLQCYVIIYSVLWFSQRSRNSDERRQKKNYKTSYINCGLGCTWIEFMRICNVVFLITIFFCCVYKKGKTYYYCSYSFSFKILKKIIFSFILLLQIIINFVISPLSKGDLLKKNKEKKKRNLYCFFHSF